MKYSFGILEDVIKQTLKLKRDSILSKIWRDQRIKDMIISLNTIDQLYEYGIDSKGISLGDYAPYTIQIKIQDGLPFDRITLYQTGKFYGSFKVKASKGGFKIEANEEKPDANLVEIYGIDIIGLTNRNIKYLSDEILDDIIKQIKEILHI